MADLGFLASCYGLILLLQGDDVGEHFGIGPILRTDDLAVDAALTVDDVGFGVHRGAVSEGNFFRGVSKRGEGDIVCFQEIIVGVLVVVEADAEDGPADRTDAFLQLVERRGFLNAGRAPRGPEIQHNDLAAVVGKLYGFSVKRELEILFGMSAKAGLALTIIGVSEQGNESSDKEDDQRRGEILFQSLFKPLIMRISANCDDFLTGPARKGTEKLDFRDYSRPQRRSFHRPRSRIRGGAAGGRGTHCY